MNLVFSLGPRALSCLGLALSLSMSPDVLAIDARPTAASKPAATSELPAPAKTDASAPRSEGASPEFQEATSPSPVVSAKHPLKSVLEYAREEQAYTQRKVRDFTCRLVKRERIEDVLQDYSHIEMRVREPVMQGDDVVKPMAIYLHFLAPGLIRGRKVLYVEGENDGKMLIRNGGKRFEYVVTDIDPYGESAQRESLVPVPRIGFDNLMAQMLDILKRHAEADPEGVNTKVQKIAGAKVNKRACTVIRITHPKPQPGLEFHVANVFVDQELHLPVRVDFSGWPKLPGQAPPLMAEYTYTDLKINQNLPDSAFRSLSFESEELTAAGVPSSESWRHRPAS